MEVTMGSLVRIGTSNAYRRSKPIMQIKDALRENITNPQLLKDTIEAFDWYTGAAPEFDYLMTRLRKTRGQFLSICEHGGKPLRTMEIEAINLIGLILKHN